MEPQLILVYNEKKEIQDTYFFSYSDLTNSYVWNIYNLLYQTESEVFLNDYQILKEHIPLTFNIEQTIGYLRHILNIPESIVIFSLIDNLQFYYDNDVFNPFDDNIINVKKQTDDPLYQIYNNATEKLIICIAINKNNNSFIQKNASNGIFEKYWKVYMDKILDNIFRYNYVLRVNEQVNSTYNCNLSSDFIIKLLNDNNYKCRYLKTFDNYLLLAGSDFEYNTQEVLFECYQDKLIFKYDKNLYIIDSELWDKIPTNYKETLIIRNKQDLYKTVVSFDVELKFIIDLDIDFNFIIKPTEKTKNIYIDVYNKITIITSKDHISFRSKQGYSGMAKYLTLIILGYNNINFDIKEVNKNLKVKGMYRSRFCQNSKTVLRKPVRIDNINLEEHIKVSDNFYKGPIKKEQYYVGSKLVTKEIKVSDVYVNNDIYYQCPGIENTYMSFLENIQNYANECIPCCYNSPNKYNTQIFNRCTKNSNDSAVISPYLELHDNKLKVLFSDNKLGELSPEYNKIFNKNSKINFIKSRIVNAKNYVCYKKYSYNQNIYSYDDIITFNESLDKKSSIIIFNDNFYIDELLNTEYEVFIIIKNKIHKLVEINKESTKDKISISELNKELIQWILSKFKKYYNDPIIKFKNEYIKIDFNYNKLYVNDKKYNYKNIPQFVKFNFTNENYTIPYNIDKIVTKEIDQYIMTRNLNCVS